MKKIPIVFLFPVFLVGCMVYTNDKTYYGEIVFRNTTNSTATIVIDGSSSSDADTMYGIPENKVQPNETKAYTVSWKPGNYSVIVIDGADEDDAHAAFNYTINSDSIHCTGQICFNIKSSVTKYVSLYKMPLNTKYSFMEFQQLLALIGDKNDKEIIKSIYYQNFSQKNWELNIYKFLFKTRSENDETIESINTLFAKYDNAKKGEVSLYRIK